MRESSRAVRMLMQAAAVAQAARSMPGIKVILEEMRRHEMEQARKEATEKWLQASEQLASTFADGATAVESLELALWKLEAADGLANPALFRMRQLSDGYNARMFAPYRRNGCEVCWIAGHYTPAGVIVNALWASGSTTGAAMPLCWQHFGVWHRELQPVMRQIIETYSSATLRARAGQE